MNVFVRKAHTHPGTILGASHLLADAPMTEFLQLLLLLSSHFVFVTDLP
jgi:hypothetical protein